MRKNGHADVVKILHANVGADFSIKIDKNLTAAILERQNGRADGVKILHANVGANLNVKIDKALTAAMLTRANGYADVVKTPSQMVADFSKT